jgi:hypothetical protein
MRKIKPEAICELPNLTFKLALSAKRLAAKELALEAAQRELALEKAVLFERLIAEYGYDVLREAGVL